MHKPGLNSLPSYVPGTKKRLVETRLTSKRVYRVWQGSNRFFLGGRLIFGPDVRSMIITVFLIVIPVILFTVFVSKRLVDELKHHAANFILNMPIVFAAYIICLLFFTSSRDPGIIPRNSQPPEPEDDGESSTVSADWVRPHGGLPSLPPVKDVLVNGMIVKVKYCHTCMLYRPPRCSHCSICNNCVERFDHHCPWVGQCIGKRNYRFFYMFVSSTTTLCLYVFSFCWVHLVKLMQIHHCSLWRAFLKSPVSGILIIYTFIAAWFVGGLTAFHTYLVCTNQTTYENFRYRYDVRLKNPYNRGCFMNILEIFFSKIPKSQNHFRARVKQEVHSYPSSVGRESPDTAKAGDVEMVGKRQAVAEEEIDDIQSQIESCSGLDHTDSLPQHSRRDSLKEKLEIPPKIEVLSSVEAGLENGTTEKEKIKERG